MLFDEISLTPQEILEKEFKIDARGYRAQEVDKFLDMVISDYTKFISLIKKIESENKDLLEESLELKQELRDYKDKLDILKEGNNKEITNIDLLKRISQLEKIVFKDNE